MLRMRIFKVLYMTLCFKCYILNSSLHLNYLSPISKMFLDSHWVNQIPDVTSQLSSRLQLWDTPKVIFCSWKMAFLKCWICIMWECKTQCVTKLKWALKNKVGPEKVLLLSGLYDKIWALSFFFFCCCCWFKHSNEKLLCKQVLWMSFFIWLCKVVNNDNNNVTCAKHRWASLAEIINVLTFS